MQFSRTNPQWSIMLWRQFIQGVINSFVGKGSIVYAEHVQACSCVDRRLIALNTIQSG